MELTSNVDVDATSNVDMLDPTRNVNIDATCNVDMELTSNIDVDATSNVDMPDPTSNVNMDATSNVGVDSNVDMDSSGSEYRTEIDSDEDSCDSGEIVSSSDVNNSSLTISNYSKFCKYTMCEINMFNGKRGCEVQRLKLGDLKLKDDDDDIDEEVLKTIDAHEIRLCKVF